MDTTNFQPVPTAPPSDQNLNQYPPQQFTQQNIPPPSYNQVVMSQKGQTVYQPSVQVVQTRPMVVQQQVIYQPQGHVHSQVGATSNIEPVMVSRIPEETLNASAQCCTRNQLICFCAVWWTAMFLCFLPMIIMFSTNPW